MSAAPRRWLRLDADWEESSWLDEMSGEAAGCWPRLLCWVKLRGKSGRCRKPDRDVLARRWRVSRAAVDVLFSGALKDGAIGTEGDELVVTNWVLYQEPDNTNAERQARFRERNGSNAVTDPSPPVTPPLPVTRPPTETPDIDQTAVTAIADDPAAWMHEVWQNELGTPGRAISLNQDRRQKYRAMYDEQLKGTPDPRTAWLGVLWAVKQSEHHMSQRAYQMPESFLKSESRRERWVLTALDLIAKGAMSEQEQNVIKIREYLRRNEA